MTSAQRIARTPQFQARVAAVCALSPKMRRLALQAPEIADQAWPLGCDIAVVLAGEDGREVRRRYTVRSAAGDQLTLDAVLHGRGAGSTWAAAAAIGDEVTFFGPRGEVPRPDPGPVLAVTDEAGLPAIGALADALADGPDRPLRVIAEIADDGERYPLPEHVAVTWLARGEQPAGDPALLVAAIDALGQSSGAAYALAESRAVLALREALIAGGLDRSRIYAKGYWNLRSRATR